MKLYGVQNKDKKFLYVNLPVGWMWTPVPQFRQLMLDKTDAESVLAKIESKQPELQGTLTIAELTLSWD